MSNGYRWLLYDGVEKSGLTASSTPELFTERACPHCGRKSVRTYHHKYKKFERRGQLIQWCALCCRFGTTFVGGGIDGYAISNPLKGTPLESMIENKSPQSYLWKLNARWDKGELPQILQRIEPKIF